jgi:hypothetical protein
VQSQGVLSSSDQAMALAPIADASSVGNAELGRLLAAYSDMVVGKLKSQLTAQKDP